MTLCTRVDFDALRGALRARGLDGWLIYDFHGINPVAARVVGVAGMGTRRLFIWFPADGKPVALAHRIELQPLEGFPGEVRAYASWESLHAELGRLVSGHRVAMEVSQDDDVPYLDRVPHGMVQLIERLGGTIESSAELVTLFAAKWTPDELAGHRKAAEILARIAQDVLAEVVAAPAGKREWAVQQDVLARMARGGWSPRIRRSWDSGRMRPTRTTNRSKGLTGRWRPIRWCCSTCGAGRVWEVFLPIRRGWGSPAGPCPTRSTGCGPSCGMRVTLR